LCRVARYRPALDHAYRKQKQPKGRLARVRKKLER
jgi:hypothetical protein